MSVRLGSVLSAAAVVLKGPYTTLGLHDVGRMFVRPLEIVIAVPFNVLKGLCLELKIAVLSTQSIYGTKAAKQKPVFVMSQSLHISICIIIQPTAVHACLFMPF